MNRRIYIFLVTLLLTPVLLMFGCDSGSPGYEGEYHEWEDLTVFRVSNLSASSSVSRFEESQVEASVKPPVSRPDIIVIVADDLGYMDVGTYNEDSFYDTPRLDRLAQQSHIFTNAYSANPVCSPSRYALMTGRYPSRVNATNWFSGKRRGRFQSAILHDHMDLNELTIAEVLRGEGYRTAFIGKWHLGEDESLWPEAQGFDVNIGGWSRGRPKSYFSPYSNARLEDGPDGEHLPVRLTDEAIGFLDGERGRPAFLFLSYYSVHDPFQAPDELVEKYEERADAVEGELFGNEQQYWPLWKWLGKRKVRIRQSHPTYAAMVESMDTQVGRLLDYLEESGRMKNTLVVFTSDNGGLSTSEGHPTSNLPLRGGKGWVYEGGIRVPLFITLPGTAGNGVRLDEPVMGIDLWPTVAAFAGVDSGPAGPVDGVNLLPLMEYGNPLERESLYWHYPHYSNQGGFPGGAIRQGRYKLVENYEDGSVALYDLARDPGEQMDLSESEPGMTQRMRMELHGWYREVDAQLLRPGRFHREPWRPRP